MEIKKLWLELLIKQEKEQNLEKETFTIVLPPPNITGSLHIGHFLNWSLQDTLIRQAYLDGKRVEWIPGIDHAGIATQYVVERELAKEGKTRQEVGRTAFEKMIQEWKIKAENLVSEQALTFGFFFDWEKRHFTMDPNYKKQVVEAFCKLYEDGLISKKERITHWDPAFQTALSDLEIIEKIEKRKMYTICYNSKSGKSINIATTRPETIFADSAIAVHPEDERFSEILNEKFEIPLIKREIPIVVDVLCDMEKGTGAVKVTPAHDHLDHMIGEKHNLEKIQIIDKEGRLFGVPTEFVGLKTLEAREKVLEALRKSGNLVEEKDWEGIVYYGEKSPLPIETIMTEQWFLDTSKMAKRALEVVENGEIKFVPDYVKETFRHWMNNIKPWCISRQIWWGHQIPIWYTKSGKTICASTQERARALAAEFGEYDLTQETDVLDTWFSSALWPIATRYELLGDIFEPTDVVVTGSDILFFWIARMIMFSLYFKNKIPFKFVYFNGIIRDAQRQKMSKTKGNVLNPLDLSKEYGSDSLRFALLRQATPGKDLSVTTNDIESARALGTKFKNATRFLKEFMQQNEKSGTILHEWMETKIAQAKKQIKNSINNFAIHEAANYIYDIFWEDFCSWYIEGLKQYPNELAKELFGQILQMSHPIIPWNTEECWQEFNQGKSILEEQFKPLKEFDVSRFEDVILATKILRKLKILAKLESFDLKTNNSAGEKDYINQLEEQKTLIKFYTKLEMAPCDEIKIKAGSLILGISKEKGLAAISGVEKELAEEQNEIKQLKEKIEQAQNVPEKILEEWKMKLKKKIEIAQVLTDWLADLNRP